MGDSRADRDPRAKWDREEPATAKALEALAEAAPVDLPEEYLELLLHSNGGEGNLGVDPGWFRLWAAERVMEHNSGYGVLQYLPGFLAFGSSGGGELLAFDCRGDKPWAVVMVPAATLAEEDVIRIARDFAAFADALGREQQSA